MRLIKQRNEIDCGLAIAAMLACCSYHEARQADPYPNKTVGLSTGEMRTVLKRLEPDNKYLIIKPAEYKQLSDIKPFTGAAIIRQPDRKYGHWVCSEVTNDGTWMIYDPELERPTPINVYDRRSWLLIRKVCMAGKA